MFAANELEKTLTGYEFINQVNKGYGPKKAKMFFFVGTI